MKKRTSDLFFQKARTLAIAFHFELISALNNLSDFLLQVITIGMVLATRTLQCFCLALFDHEFKKAMFTQ